MTRRRPYAAGVAILVTLLLSSAFCVEWVDVGGNLNPAVNPQRVSPPAPVVGGNNVTTVPLSPSNGGSPNLGGSPMGLEYVYIDPGLYSIWTYPWYGDAGSMRWQSLYPKELIGRAGTIHQMAVFKDYYPDSYNGTFPNVTIKLCNTTVASLSSSFSGNYGSGEAPVTVFHASSLPRGQGSGSFMWDDIDFDTDFDYDNTKNLLVEVTWAGSASGYVYTWGSYVSSSLMAYNAGGDINSDVANTSNYLINTRIGFVPEPPEVPELVSPLNDAYCEPIDGTLTWNAADRATGYDVYLGMTYLSMNCVSPDQTGTTYTYSGLLNEQTYYWKVVAKNYGGQTASDVWHFTTVPAPGWAKRASLSGSPAEGAGGWLAYNPSDGLIYAARGEGTGDFYSYDQRTNQWSSLASIPPFHQGNKWFLPSYGCRGVVDDHGDIYMTLGNKTGKFLRYSAGDWSSLQDVPNSAKLFKGTDAVFASGCVYLLDGANGRFYRYDPNGVSPWSDLGGLPPNPTAIWPDGSWLIFDGDHTLYAQQALTAMLYAYDLSSLNPTWISLTGVPSTSYGYTGTGGAAAWFNNTIRALKGNNSKEFWRYVPDDDAWYALPAIGGKVGVGGDILATPCKLFAFRGSKSNELWRYVPDPSTGFPAGVGSEPTSTTGVASIDLLPNPAKGRFAVVRYSLPQVEPQRLSLLDVSGRVVMTRDVSANSRDGALSIDLSGLNAGVYLVRITGADLTISRKLVVQR